MMKHSRLAVTLMAVSFLPGCAQSVSQSMGRALASAPDWFDERRDEVAGEGYPEFSEVPEQPAPLPATEKQKVISEQDQLLSEAKGLRADPKAQTPKESGKESPSDLAARIREEVENGVEASQSGLVEETKLP